MPNPETVIGMVYHFNHPDKVVWFQLENGGSVRGTQAIYEQTLAFLIGSRWRLTVREGLVVQAEQV